MFMWRAVDQEGGILDVLVQKRRNKVAALKLLNNRGAPPEQIVTDGLASYRPAMKVLGCQYLHGSGRLRDDNGVENSHLPVRRRERKMQRFKSQGQAQRFASSHSTIYNTISIQRHLTSRSTMRDMRAAAMAGMECCVRRCSMNSPFQGKSHARKVYLTTPNWRPDLK